MRLRWYVYVGFFVGVTCGYLLHGLTLSGTVLENGDQGSLYAVLNRLTPSEATLSDGAVATPRGYLVESVFFIGLPMLIIAEAIFWRWKWKGAS